MRIRKLPEAIALMLLTLLVALFTTPSASAATNNSELQRRLENLATELEKQRVAFHIPGMAIAANRCDRHAKYSWLGSYERIGKQQRKLYRVQYCRVAYQAL